MATRKTAGIREAIQLVLAILSDCGCPRVPSEALRQAKYDEPQARNTFWELLHYLMHVLMVLHDSELTQRLQGSGGDVREALQVVGIPQGQPVSRRLIHSIRRYAFELNYHRHEFYTDVEAVGSRELLLFFAWLLHSTSLVPKLCHYHVTAARYSVVSVPPSKQFLLQEIEEETAGLEKQIKEISDSLSGINSDSPDIENILLKLLWIKGKLKGACSSAQSAEEGAVRVAHNLLQSCGAPSRKHPLSLQELFVLRHPSLLSSLQQRLEWHVVSLQHLLQWSQHELVFWQWMESVLDITHIQRPIETSVTSSNSQTQCKTLENISAHATGITTSFGTTTATVNALASASANSPVRTITAGSSNASTGRIATSGTIESSIVTTPSASNSVTLNSASTATAVPSDRLEVLHTLVPTSDFNQQSSCAVLGDMEKEVCVLGQRLQQVLTDRRVHIDKVQHVWRSKKRSQTTTAAGETKDTSYSSSRSTCAPLCLPLTRLETVVCHTPLDQPSRLTALSAEPQGDSLGVKVVDLASRVEEVERDLQELQSTIAEHLKQHMYIHN